MNEVPEVAVAEEPVSEALPTAIVWKVDDDLYSTEEKAWKATVTTLLDHVKQKVDVINDRGGTDKQVATLALQLVRERQPDKNTADLIVATWFKGSYPHGLKPSRERIL